MKPVFKCDYCNFMGTELEVKKHEPKCTENYTRRNCWTCQYRCIQDLHHLKCDVGREIPEDSIIEFCPQYRRKEKADWNGKFNDIFSSMLGGL